MTADELLQNAILSEGNVETTTEDDNICIIDPKTREIQLPVGGLLLGVESDENVERIVFQCPKIVGDGVDLSTLAIRINYSNANSEGSQSIAENVQEHGDNITFEWLLPRHVTMYKGTVNFIVCAVKAENYIISNEWNTTLAKATVLEGLEVDQVEVPSDQQDVIAQLIQLINAAQKSTSEDAASAKASAESAASSKTSASDSATVASNAQKVAQQSATEAASSAGSAADSASSAEQSKTSAEESANAAKQSEDNAKQIADNIGIDDNVVSSTQLWSSKKGVKSFAPLVSALKVGGSGDGLVSLTPTVPWYLQGLRLYGRSVQDGTPTKDNAIPWTDAGAAGSIPVEVHRENMIPYPYSSSGSTSNGITFAVLEDGSISLNGTATGIAYFDISRSFNSDLYAGRYLGGLPQGIPLGINGLCYRISGADRVSLQDFAGQNPGKILSSGSGLLLSIRIASGCTCNNVIVQPFVSANANGAFSSSGEHQSLSVETSDSLPGLPIESGGNFIDANGQSWLCDEMDPAAGRYTRRCTVVELLSTMGWKLSSSGNWLYVALSNLRKINGSPVLCNYFAPGNWSTGQAGTICLGNGSTAVVGISTQDFPTVDDLKNWLDEKKQAGTPCLFVAPLATPVVSEIPAETLAAYAALQSYAGTTNILAEGCGIEVIAIADTDVYMSQQFEKFLQTAKEYADQKMQQSTEPEQ